MLTWGYTDDAGQVFGPFGKQPDAPHGGLVFAFELCEGEDFKEAALEAAGRFTYLMEVGK